MRQLSTSITEIVRMLSIKREHREDLVEALVVWLGLALSLSVWELTIRVQLESPLLSTGQLAINPQLTDGPQISD